MMSPGLYVYGAHIWMFALHRAPVLCAFHMYAIWNAFASYEYLKLIEHKKTTNELHSRCCFVCLHRMHFFFHSKRTHMIHYHMNECIQVTKESNLIVIAVVIVVVRSTITYVWEKERELIHFFVFDSIWQTESGNENHIRKK